MTLSKYTSNDGTYPIGFKIFYGDFNETIFVGKGSFAKMKKAWGEAPNDYVQIIIIYENTFDSTGKSTRFNFQGADFYSFDGKDFMSSNDSRLCKGVIKNGKWISDHKFEQIRDKALDDHFI